MFDWKLLRALVMNQDFITSDKFLDLCNNHPNARYVKRDYIFRDGVWRGQFIKRSNNRNTRGFNIVVGHSDYSFSTNDFVRLKALGAKSIYANNLNSIWGDFLPLGLCNNTNESKQHSIVGDVKPILKIFRSAPEKSTFPYKISANFSIDTFSQVRLKLYNDLRNLNHVNVKSPKITLSGRASYLQEIYDSHMVIVPRGNGLDTHRFWETLYMGAIPIVVRKDLPKGIFDLGPLPVIVLQNWNQICNANFIYSEYDKVQSMHHQESLISFTNWKKILCRRFS